MVGRKGSCTKESCPGEVNCPDTLKIHRMIVGKEHARCYAKDITDIRPNQVAILAIR